MLLGDEEIVKNYLKLGKFCVLRIFLLEVNFFCFINIGVFWENFFFGYVFMVILFIVFI